MLELQLQPGAFYVSFLFFCWLFFTLHGIFIVKGKRRGAGIYLMQKQYENESWHLGAWAAGTDYPRSSCLAVKLLMRTQVAVLDLCPTAKGF